MACSNCDCKQDAVPVPDKTVELEKNLRTMAFIIEKLKEQLADVNKFLYDKYPTDLIDGAGQRVTCSYYTYHQKRREEESRLLEETIIDLQLKGYIVAKPEAPSEPTLETSIREVVLANTVVK